jgi:hypothetical protein
MTLPKKGTRKIKVAGKTYRWRLSNTHVDQVVIENEEGIVKTIGFPQDKPDDDRYEYAPITPADVVLAIRFGFLNEKVELPSFETRLARHRKQGITVGLGPVPEGVVVPLLVKLEVTSCDVLRPRGGTDKVILELAPNQAIPILKASVGEERAKDVFENQLHCTFDITRGCGEKLAAALGITNVKLIEM